MDEETDDVSCMHTIHDLAAFHDGNLSNEGMKRLLTHLSECRSCLMQSIQAARVQNTPQEDREYAWRIWLAGYMKMLNRQMNNAGIFGRLPINKFEDLSEKGQKEVREEFDAWCSDPATHPPR